MYNEQGITNAYYKLLVSEYDRVNKYVNNPSYISAYATERDIKLMEFIKSCSISINSFEEKVAFMLQFNEKFEEEKRNKEKETLKEKKEKLIELAKKRYDSKSPLWKVFNKKINPDKINFDNMSIDEINKLYNEENSKKTR